MCCCARRYRACTRQRTAGEHRRQELPGASTLYRLQLPTGSQLEAIFPSHNDHQVGEDVGIAVKADHLVLFPVPGSVAAQLPRQENGVRRYSSAT
jgi:iron(III) transport system ATP-binding protein